MEPKLFSDADMAGFHVSARPSPHPFTDLIDHHVVVLDNEAATFLFRMLLETTPWARRSLKLYGKEVGMLRDIAWYGASKEQVVYSADARPKPHHRLEVKAQVEERTVFPYNVCLCNLYRDGSNPVAWHCHKEAFGGAVALLSLRATRMFRVLNKSDHALPFDFPLPSDPLLLMKPGCQEHSEHCVPKTKRPVGPRIKHTLRKVR